MAMIAISSAGATGAEPRVDRSGLTRASVLAAIRHRHRLWRTVIRSVGDDDDEAILRVDRPGVGVLRRCSSAGRGLRVSYVTELERRVAQPGPESAATGDAVAESRHAAALDSEEVAVGVRAIARSSFDRQLL